MSVLAFSEEDPLCWVERDGTTRARARHVAIDDGALDGHDPGEIKVSAGWMRPARCLLHPDGIDWDVDDEQAAVEESYRDGCECTGVLDGFYFECKRSHVDAIAVWRVELA